MKLSKVIERLEALERHHKILGAVACRVCGSPMEFMSTGNPGWKYVCKAAVDGWKEDGYSVRSEWWDHMHESEMIVDYGVAKIHASAAKSIRNVLEGREWSYHPEAEEFGMWLGMTGLFELEAED